MRDVFVQKAEPLDYYALSEDAMKVVRCMRSPVFRIVNAEGEILALGGLENIYPETAEAWFYISENGKKYVALPGAVRKTIVHLQLSKKIERVHAFIRASSEVENRFVRWLGFEKEAVVQCWRQGEDFNLYRRIRRWR